VLGGTPDIPVCTIVLCHQTADVYMNVCYEGSQTSGLKHLIKCVGGEKSSFNSKCMSNWY